MAMAMMGFQVVGAVASGMQQRADAMDQAAQQELNARLAETQTLQRDTIAREDLLSAQSATQAARAANGLSPITPNALQIYNDRRSQADRDRLVAKADGQQRVANFKTAAKSSRRRGRMSLATGLFKAGVPLAQYGYSEGWFG